MESNKMKNKQILGMLAMMSATMNQGYIKGFDDVIDITPKEKPLPNGCKKYVYKEDFGTLKVIALNEKSALKKYNKWCLNNRY